MQTKSQVHFTTSLRLKSRTVSLALVLGMLFLTVCGCEEEISLIDTDRGFSLYGVLNPQQDTQWVHVFPITASLHPGSGDPLTSSFTSKVLSTGEMHQWRDSVVQDLNGVFSHVFWAPFRVSYEHEYRIRMENAGGRASEVDIRVPPLVSPRVGETSHGGSVVIPVDLTGDVERLLKVRLKVWGRVQTASFPSMEYVAIEKSFSYDSHVFKHERGWTVAVDLSATFQPMQDTLALYVGPKPAVQLLLLTLDLILANAEWNPPGGLFDPRLHVHPEIMTNVRNGFGFVGAGYRIRHQWKPDSLATTRAGYDMPR